MANLAHALVDAAARGAAAWPDVALTAAELTPWLEEKLAGAEDPVAALASLHVTDLFLACACLKGDLAAVAAFEARVLPEARAAVRELSQDSDFQDDVRQRVREHVLVGTAEAPAKLADYAGRGPLAGWVRIVAVRIGLQLLRSESRGRKRAERQAQEPALPKFDMELDYLRARYRQPFKEAFQGALRNLSAQDRNALQLHLIDGISLAQIAQLHGVNKSTVSRWMARAREQILTAVRAELHEKLGVEETELESLMGLFRSRIDLSVDRILRDG